MKARELRQKSIGELTDAEEELREQLFKLRFQKATGQIQNPIKIRLVRKEIARLLTIRAERLREAE
ncbi:MAG: 50S ribosomal protein L29 [Thermoanaerobaculaceae bacterium]|nr:50S ribosomal protein L29 [Thermoanaerobaculaceae bacterium]MDI9622324.1 50S ribosomal protein L29 [Acidobacteriota bacterium]NLH10600.1 50S ribosomal protein L29 [Holophagae bacterium]HPW55078.1 50S ribosomal protein L29 [Thermoanaerobaculaceae bacterium]